MKKIRKIMKNKIKLNGNVNKINLNKILSASVKRNM